MTDGHQPDSLPRPGANVAAPNRITRWGRAPLFHRMPELDLVPDEATRHRILSELERDMTPRTWKSAAQFLVAVALFLILPVAAGYLVSKVLMTPRGLLNNWVFLIIVLVGYTAIVILAMRRDMPKALRTKLNALGIPVCMRCGHDLHGGEPARVHCPECGARLSAVEADAVRRAAARTSS